MKKNLQEIEVKFFVNALPVIASRLKEQQANMISDRTLEVNYRFDTPDQKLTRNLQVLRLRKDRSATMTFKSAADPTSEVSSRQEIEFEVGNFVAAKLFLQALGYQVNIVYEKYRTIYELNNCEVMLDELPYGDFVEIEGADASAIRKTASMLQLDWGERIKLSYLAIFYKAKEHFNLKAGNLMFKEVERPQIPMQAFLSNLTDAR